MSRTDAELPREPMRIISAKRVAALLAACTSASVSAAMFRSTDKDGVTAYTQFPPASGEPVEIEKQPDPSAETVDAARERFRREREQTFDELQAREEAATLKEKEAADEAKRAENCAAARKNLAGFQNLGPRMIRTPDGRYLRLSQEEVKAEIEKAQGQVETLCK